MDIISDSPDECETLFGGNLAEPQEPAQPQPKPQEPPRPVVTKVDPKVAMDALKQIVAQGERDAERREATRGQGLESALAGQGQNPAPPVAGDELANALDATANAQEAKALPDPVTIAAFRFVLIEFDAMPLTRQIEFWAGWLANAKLSTRLAALTFSGGKSLHGLVTLGTDGTRAARKLKAFPHGSPPPAFAPCPR